MTHPDDLARSADTGRHSLSRGVVAVGASRIRFDFMFDGVRYRPSLPIIPTEMNLRRARAQIDGIKQRITQGTFSFAEDFPDYRFLNRTPKAGSPRTCNQVFDTFLAHCEARHAKHDMAAITLARYRRVIDGFWRPRIGVVRFLDIRHSTLVALADSPEWSKKTYNNAISVLRRAFKFGYRDHPGQHNPTLSLASARIKRRDRAKIDPFTIQDAETLIGSIQRDWGEAQGNYDEFRFFTGLGPSEQVALLLDDFDAARGTLRVNKARVAGVYKASTKTREDRCIVLCPRALQVIQRQLALRERLKGAGQIDHEHLFFKANGDPIRSLQYPYVRWRRTLQRLTIRYRKPYSARHSSVSWNLDGRHEPALGRETARPQHRDHAACLRRLDGRSP
jgi:integrase